MGQHGMGAALKLGEPVQEPGQRRRQLPVIRGRGPEIPFFIVMLHNYQSISMRFLKEGGGIT